ncbi:MAG: oligosaccharide flippase family protein [Oscillospiraceae bacterium]|nr:oligosaccharide flippase family protein [Oscillospiraceae bacterium]
MRKKGMLYGAAVLTLSSIMTRLVGVVFSILLSNTLGAEGIGLFQLIFSFYALTINLSRAGISTAVSRLVAECAALSQSGRVRKIMRGAVGISLLLSLTAAAAAIIFSDKIALSFLKDRRAVKSILAFAPSLVFISVSSCYKGYFFAVNEIVKPASSEFVEQAIRMGFIFLLLKISVKDGLSCACAGIFWGYTAGELASLLYLYAFYRPDLRRKFDAKAAGKGCLKDIAQIAAPLSISSNSTSFLRMEEDILILAGLKQYRGSYESAISTYGVLCGMVMPTLMLPSALLTSVSIAILPKISRANARGDKKAISDTVSKVLQFTCIMSVLVVGIFAAFPDEIGLVIYNNAEMGPMLRILAPICVCIYLEITAAGVLNVTGEQMSTLWYNLADSLLRLLLVYLFVPRYGFTAFLITMIISNIFTSTLCIRRLYKVAKIRFDFVNWLLKPLIAVGATVLNMSFFCRQLLFGRVAVVPGLLIALIFSAMVYIFMNYLIGTFSKSDADYFRGLYRRKSGNG